MAKFTDEAPTGGLVTSYGMHFHRIADGRIAEDWEVIDFAPRVHHGLEVECDDLRSRLGDQRTDFVADALGIAYDEVDYVFCTHLHIDHTGWNTTLRDGRWVPTFPNAKCLFSRADDAYWDVRKNPAMATDPRHMAYEDSVLPVVQSGQAVLVDDGHRRRHVTQIAREPREHPRRHRTDDHDRQHRASRGARAFPCQTCRAAR